MAVPLESDHVPDPGLERLEDAEGQSRCPCPTPCLEPQG